MAASWEELEQKYSGGASAPSASGSDPWAALEQKYTVSASSGGSDATPTKGGKESAAPKEVTLGDRVRAAATGVNKGFFADLLGMPVDAAANALDLGKAAVGLSYNEVKKLATGKPSAPPEWTAPFDRSSVPGSSEWIGRQINAGANKLGVASPINNPNEADPLSRVLHMGGRVAGGSISPDPRAKISAASQLTNTGMGTIGGLLAGATGEVAPEWAGLAGLLPQAAAATAAGGVKRAVRGGEQGRKDMEQRIQDLKNGGIDEPSVGLASGNSTIMGLENLLSQTPGSVGLFAAARERNLAGMQNRTNQIRDDISPTFGRVEAGSAVQSDLKGAFKDRIGNTYGVLNDRVEAAVGPNSPVPVTESVRRSGQLTTPIPGAEATSTNFINPRIAKINRDLTADSGGMEQQIINSMILGADGNPAFQRVIPAMPPQGVPFSALKDLRTRIGKESQSNAIMGTPEQADFKQMYGAMSQDMRNGVGMADLRNGILPTAPGSATTALNRANDYYSTAMKRADDLNPLANRSTPEGAFSAISSSLDAGGTLYKKLRGAVTPETRQKVVATAVDELGRSTAGQQNADGTAWSPRTFLTNYSKLHENGGGTELFKRLPGGMQHADRLADIAKTADMLGESSKIWANPSGTAPAITARGTVYALTAGAFFQPVVAAGTAASLVGMNQVSQRLLLNPSFVNWLAKAPSVPPAKAQAYAQRLLMNAKMTNDKQYRSDVQSYLESVQDAFKEAE